MVYDLTTATQTGQILLEGFDTWVRGIGVAGGMLHLMDDGRERPFRRIVRFELDGSAVSEVSIDGAGWTGPPSGLWCDAPPEP